MKAILLAAGYATRLYPLTLSQPKPLLACGGKPIIDHILEKILKIEGLERIFVVTNDKFYAHFEQWADAKGRIRKKLLIINDGTLTNEDRLGAIGDIKFVADNQSIRDDLLVAGGDNIFDFDLSGFVRFARLKAPSATVGLYDVGDTELAKKYGIVELGADGRIVNFSEKPKNPRSTLAAMCVYYLPREVVALLDDYFIAGRTMDAPGNFIKWLAEQNMAFGYVFKGSWYDIGDKISLEKADSEYSGKIGTDTYF